MELENKKINKFSIRPAFLVLLFFITIPFFIGFLVRFGGDMFFTPAGFILGIIGLALFFDNLPKLILWFSIKKDK